MDVYSSEFRDLCRKWHNKMWLWISKEIEKSTFISITSKVYNLKGVFVERNVDDILQDFKISFGYLAEIMTSCNYCFACYYAKSVSGAETVYDYRRVDEFCLKCPIRWIPEYKETPYLFFCENSDSLYGGLPYAVSPQECSDICKQISELSWDRCSEDNLTK